MAWMYPNTVCLPCITITLTAVPREIDIVDVKYIYFFVILCSFHKLSMFISQDSANKVHNTYSLDIYIITHCIFLHDSVMSGWKRHIHRYCYKYLGSNIMYFVGRVLRIK
jgi:hypothetical protein